MNILNNFRELIVNIVNAGYLPTYMSYTFVINSLISTILIGPILGMFGTMVVTKKMAFFSEAIGHSALAGISIGILLGEPYESPYIMLFTYCIIFGILINYTKNRTKMSSDTLIGIFLAISIALGGTLIILVTAKVNAHMLESLLFGSILTVNDTDILILAISSLFLLIITVTNFNKILLSSFNENIALVKGINVKLIEYVFIVLVTLITISSIKIIGIALVEALFLIPAASAKNLAKSIKGFFFYSIFFAVISSVLGIILPLALNIAVPSGSAIILIAALFFFITIIIKNVK